MALGHQGWPVTCNSGTGVKTRIYGNHWRFAAIITNLAFVLLCAPLGVAAQDTLPVPDSPSEPQGLMAEPKPITRVALFADRHLGKGDLNNGFYVVHGKMIPGAGWIALRSRLPPVVRP